MRFLGRSPPVLPGTVQQLRHLATSPRDGPLPAFEALMALWESAIGPFVQGKTSRLLLQVSRPPADTDGFRTGVNVRYTLGTSRKNTGKRSLCAPLL